MHGTDLRLASQTAHKRKSNTLESKQKEIQMEIWIGTDTDTDTATLAGHK